MNDAERTELKKRLLTYPGATNESVEQELDAYEAREDEKKALTEIRKFTNALAERYLDRKGYPRPPGWHSVFFYPGSNRPRNPVVFWGIAIVAAIWYFSQ